MPQATTCEKDMPEYCRERFNKIDGRLDEGDKHFGKHDTEIATLSADMRHLTDAIGAQTKAIWGACGTALVLLLGFVFWYIQQLK